MEYEQHNKNILSSSGISNKEIQHLSYNELKNIYSKLKKK